MIRGMGRLTRLLLVRVRGAKLSGSTVSAGKSHMGRSVKWRRTVPFIAVCILLALAAGTYYCYPSSPPEIVETPVLGDTGVALSQADEFEQLAKTDPVSMLEQCLFRYQREVKDGFRCTLEKEERIRGKLLPREVIALSVRGDVPDPATKKTHIEVLMLWQSGGQKVFGSEVKGTLYVEDKGGNKDTIVTWRPSAPLFQEKEIEVNGSSARGASRYCIRDAGLYRCTLRTYEVWKQRKEEGSLITEYLGRKPVEKSGVECHVVKRICRSPEVDAFDLGGTPDLSPESVARDGFTELTIMIDTKRWLQVGTELRRADGQLIGAYYFRNIDLNPAFPKETFTKDGLLKK